MTAPAFGSVVLYVHDDPKTILDFYCAAFGLTIRYYDATAQFGELETGATSLAVAAHSAGTLMVGEPYAPYGDGNPKNTEVAFLTVDVPTAFARAVAAGCTPLCAPKQMPWGQTVAYVRSIEGTLVGLLTPVGP